MPPRSFVVTRSESRQTVATVLRARLAMSAGAVRSLVRAGRVRLAGSVCTDAGRRVVAGQRLEVAGAPASPARTPRKAQGPQPLLRFADDQVVVVDKPAGLTTMRHAGEAAEFGARARRFLPPTLADLLPPLLAAREKGRGQAGRLRAVHRLDKETTGLVVFARTVEAERHLGRQFRAHTVERRYLALVRGRPAAGTIASDLVRDRGDGRRGSSTQAGAVQHAVTHVRVLEELGDFALIECRLETGRTHQVRIHLGEAGTPLCGERVYDRPIHGKPLPDASGAKRVMLHAASLGFQHPRTGENLSWTAPLPADMAAVLERLRRQAGTEEAD